MPRDIVPSVSSREAARRSAQDSLGVRPANVPSATRLKQTNGPLGRDVHSVFVSAPEELPDVISIPSGSHFVLFLAWDAVGVPDERVLQAAISLVRGGLSYVVTWGPDCERVHDLFDRADIEVNPESNVEGTDTVIMSTWHHDESIEDALWFALNVTYPAVPYENTTVVTIAATVGNAKWSETIDAYLSDLSSLNRAVGV